MASSYQSRMRAAGKCANCGKPSDTPQYWKCSGCRAKSNQRITQMRVSRFQRGRCKECGKVNIGPKRWARCLDCRLDHAAHCRRQRARRAA
jgi:hypothetical protein